jgi:hypothetical protein
MGPRPWTEHSASLVAKQLNRRAQELTDGHYLADQHVWVRGCLDHERGPDERILGIAIGVERVSALECFNRFDQTREPREAEAELSPARRIVGVARDFIAQLVQRVRGFVARAENRVASDWR